MVMKNSGTLFGFIITLFCSYCFDMFSDVLEKRFVSVDAKCYPKSYLFFMQLLENHSDRVEYIVCVQNHFENQTLKHYGTILCVPLSHLIKLESGDGFMEEYIEAYICAQMSKYRFDKLVSSMIYHGLGIAGIYLIVTRYLYLAIPIVAIGGVGYVMNLRK